MDITAELIEILQDGRLLGWEDSVTGKITPFIFGGATGGEDEEEEDESEEEESEEEEDEDEESEEDEEEEEPDDDSPTISVNRMKRIASKEKKDGRRSGRDSVLKELGFSSIEEAKRKLKSSSKAAPKPKGGGSEEDDTASLEEEREEARAQIERDRKIAKVEAQVVRKLTIAAPDADDAKIERLAKLLDLDIDETTDAEDITTAVEELKEEMPELFKKAVAKKKTRPAGSTPASDPGGRTGRRLKSAEGKGKALLASRHPNAGKQK